MGTIEQIYKNLINDNIESKLAKIFIEHLNAKFFIEIQEFSSSTHWTKLFRAFSSLSNDSYILKLREIEYNYFVNNHIDNNLLNEFELLFKKSNLDVEESDYLIILEYINYFNKINEKEVAYKILNLLIAVGSQANIKNIGPEEINVTKNISKKGINRNLLELIVRRINSDIITHDLIRLILDNIDDYTERALFVLNILFSKSDLDKISNDYILLLKEELNNQLYDHLSRIRLSLAECLCYIINKKIKIAQEKFKTIIQIIEIYGIEIDSMDFHQIVDYYNLFNDKSSFVENLIDRYWIINESKSNYHSINIEEYYFYSELRSWSSQMSRYYEIDNKWSPNKIIIRSIKAILNELEEPKRKDSIDRIYSYFENYSDSGMFGISSNKTLKNIDDLRGIVFINENLNNGQVNRSFNFLTKEINHRRDNDWRYDRTEYKGYMQNWENNDLYYLVDLALKNNNIKDAIQYLETFKKCNLEYLYRSFNKKVNKYDDENSKLRVDTLFEFLCKSLPNEMIIFNLSYIIDLAFSNSATNDEYDKVIKKSKEMLIHCSDEDMKEFIIKNMIYNKEDFFISDEFCAITFDTYLGLDNIKMAKKEINKITVQEYLDKFSGGYHADICNIECLLELAEKYQVTNQQNKATQVINKAMEVAENWWVYPKETYSYHARLNDILKAYIENGDFITTSEFLMSEYDSLEIVLSLADTINNHSDD